MSTIAKTSKFSLILFSYSFIFNSAIGIPDMRSTYNQLDNKQVDLYKTSEGFESNLKSGKRDVEKLKS